MEGKSNILYKIACILLFSLVPAMQSCKQSVKNEIPPEQQIEFRKKRFRAGLRLTEMLRDKDRDLKRVLQYLDSLHREFPHDPQFYFVEGWAYDMLEDSIRARAAYTKSIDIYDSLIAAKPNFDDMINRAGIVQILYGMEAYNRALDDMQSIFNSPQDSMNIQIWRKTVIKKEELQF